MRITREEKTRWKHLNNKKWFKYEAILFNSKNEMKFITKIKLH